MMRFEVGRDPVNVFTLILTGVITYLTFQIRDLNVTRVNLARQNNNTLKNIENNTKKGI